MLPQIVAPNLQISVKPLTQEAFSPFGTVIENPNNAVGNSSHQLKVVKANQGSALKYIDVSHVTNHYNLAPSKKPAKAIMNMFVCSPRQLEPAADTSDSAPDLSPSNRVKLSKFPVEILERHPFTPQTFIPVGLAPGDETTAYLVIVAPTLPAISGKSDRPPPYPQQAPTRRRSVVEIFKSARLSLFDNTDDSSPASVTSSDPPQPKGPGAPDLGRLRAFIASGSQAVTYGPGTWHAPMVVLGARAIDFVVVQYANDVALEDCQEILVKPKAGADGLDVIVSDDGFGSKMRQRAKL